MSSDPRARLERSLEGHYRLERELGQGGMATVYLAQDLKHDRQVAIKVLHPELAAVLGADRFLAEIRLTARLQHPHILPLFDSGECAGLLYYVMPYVRGETLRARLMREQQLPVDDAVRLAQEVAGALDHAHRAGVIHRDIKPENILLQDGAALVADFGIALAVQQAGGSRMTQTGMSLGTPQYMAPEQAMGDRAVDARADIYALGAVTYEMLAGEPPFTGINAQAVMARVLTEEPPSLRGRRRAVPPAVEAAVGRALEKLPADRFGTANEFASALTAVGTPTATRALPSVRSVKTRAGGGFRAAAWLAVGLAAGMGMVRLRSESTGAAQPDGGTNRFALALPADEGMYLSLSNDVAFAPDGRSFVYLSGKGDTSWLVHRSLDQLNARRIPGSEGAFTPFFSPDGRSIGFASDKGPLMALSLAGGTPILLVPDTGATNGAAWGHDGFIYYAAVNSLRRVPSGGGRIEVLLAADTARHELVQLPATLPGGRGLLYISQTPTAREVRVLDLATRRTTSLGEGVQVQYLPGGFLAVVHDRDGSVTVAPFDEQRLVVTGPAVSMPDRAGLVPYKNGAVFSASESGSVIYRKGGGLYEGTPVWVGRDGTWRPVEAGWNEPYSYPSLSPDGTRIAMSRLTDQGRDIWVKQIGGPASRLTLDAAGYVRPSWSPDGRSVLYVAEGGDLFIQPADGSGPPRRLLSTSRKLLEGFISLDGAWIIYRVGGGAPDSRDVYARRLEGDTTTVPLLTSAAEEMAPSLSPDGHWLAYTSTESGRYEVYVRPFPDVARAKWQVSVDGGAEPVWAHSGKELFYRNTSGLVAAALALGDGVTVRGRRVLFDDKDYLSEAIHATYAVSPDDQRFLMIRSAAMREAPQLVIVTDWLAEARQRMKEAR